MFDYVIRITGNSFNGFIPTQYQRKKLNSISFHATVQYLNVKIIWTRFSLQWNSEDRKEKHQRSALVGEMFFENLRTFNEIELFLGKSRPSIFQFIFL